MIVVHIYYCLSQYFCFPNNRSSRGFTSWYIISICQGVSTSNNITQKVKDASPRHQIRRWRQRWDKEEQDANGARALLCSPQVASQAADLSAASRPRPVTQYNCLIKHALPDSCVTTSHNANHCSNAEHEISDSSWFWLTAVVTSHNQLCHHSRRLRVFICLKLFAWLAYISYCCDVMSDHYLNSIQFIHLPTFSFSSGRRTQRYSLKMGNRIVWWAKC